MTKTKRRSDRTMMFGETPAILEKGDRIVYFFMDNCFTIHRAGGKMSWEGLSAIGHLPVGEDRRSGLDLRQVESIMRLVTSCCGLNFKAGELNTELEKVEFEII